MTYSNATNDGRNSTEDRKAIEKLKRGFANKLLYQLGVWTQNASLNDYYLAVSYTVRDRMQELFLNSIQTLIEKDTKTVSYLSAEFLMGPHLHNNLVNLGIYDQVARAAEESGLDLQQIIDHEEEPGLGNGGLGRLAACYLDSLASLQVPAIGYGIRYEYGMFDQEIENGWQKEVGDRWLKPGNPWEFKKADMAIEVGSGGHTEQYTDDQGQLRVRWIPGNKVIGIPYDTPILGYRVNNVNLLRLWSAEAPKSFDFTEFNVGDYLGAVQEKLRAETITKVLYPNDEQYKGKMLRLYQQYFFVSCSMQDMIRIHLLQFDNLDNFPDKFAVQLNDTHPAIAIPEFMRLLIDSYRYGWDAAWDIVTRTFSYTNHTLLPEAMEKWPLAMLGTLLPRHLEIIYEINARFLDQVRCEYPGDQDVVQRMSIIDESGERYVRMANLACVGGHAINGVAELHTKLLKEHTLADFHRLWPEKLVNITNGVTPRRWMVVSNPRLTELICQAIGDGWITDLKQLRKLEPLVEDSSFCEKWRQVKYMNKQNICSIYACKKGPKYNPYALFDVQVKRIHEYKRQHLNLLHIITLYLRLKNNPALDIPPRLFIFGGKAAPSYFMAKLIIKLINSVAEVINGDPDVNKRLQVLFIPNYNVQIGHLVYPIADLSEQISLAGKEASGTGNMKFAMNGALTIGTLDGANVEIREEVGPENFFLFGMNVEEVQARQAAGYDPQGICNQNEELQNVLKLIATGHFSHGDRELFRPLLDSLLYDDPFMVLGDYQAYVDCQQRAGEVFKDPEQWTRMTILNAARIGKFSSDRSITEYCRKIWQVKPSPVALKLQRQVGGSITFPKRQEIVRT